MPARLRTWHLACLYAAASAILIVAADTTKNLGFLGRLCDFPNGDQAGHFFLFGVLSLLVNLSVFVDQVYRSTTRSALICSALVAALMGLEELPQTWIASRQASLADLAASYAGAVIFAWLALRISGRRFHSAHAEEV